MRIAYFRTELSRDNPGLMLRDIVDGTPEVRACRVIVDRADADILVLGGLDHDARLHALRAFNAGLRAPYPHLAGLPGNTGIDTGRDLNGDGRLGTPHDMQAWGRYAGQDGMAVLSRFPLDREAVRDLSGLLWRDVPDSRIVDRAGRRGTRAVAADVQRLSSRGHWIVPVILPGGTRLTLLAFQAGAPVFDGPEDRNGWRNRDEIRLWQHLLDGRVGRRPSPPFAIIGGANLDPADGAGRRQAIRDLLSDPRLTDPRPRMPGGQAAAEPGHNGDPGLDTVDWPDNAPGNMRVDYVLPSADLAVLEAGGLWPAPGDPLAPVAARASRHRLIWVDVRPDYRPGASGASARAITSATGVGRKSGR